MSQSYSEATPNKPLILKLNEIRKTLDVEIILYTARNMKTYQNDVSKINLHTIPVIIEWCSRYNLHIDGILVGKPYGGPGYFFVDDRCIRPKEFLAKTISELEKLMQNDSFQ